MSDFYEINNPRIERMLETIKMIERSAKSNKIERSALSDLYAPVSDALAPVRSEPETLAKEPQRPSAPRWRDVQTYADDLSAEECLTALTCISARLDFLLMDPKEGGAS